MKAILKFDLPEDQYEFEQAVDGHHWHCLVQDIDEKLRSNIKHHNIKDFSSEFRVAGVEPQLLENCYIKALQLTRDWLNEQISERDLVLYKD